MKWLDSGLPALLGLGFAVAFIDTAIERGSIGAAWAMLGQDLARWTAIAAIALGCWLVYRIAKAARARR